MKPKIIIVGLGNPGASYEGTRHNVGFMALDRIAADFKADPWIDRQKFQSLVAEADIFGVPTLLAKPNTFMNRSGEAVRKISTFYKIPLKRILVISDDVDLPLGTFRLKLTGGPGTHNGLKSIVDIFGEDFPRLRIGLGAQPEGHDLATWVLSALNREEMNVIRGVFDHLSEILKTRVENLKTKRSKHSE